MAFFRSLRLREAISLMLVTMATQVFPLQINLTADFNSSLGTLSSSLGTLNSSLGTQNSSQLDHLIPFLSDVPKPTPNQTIGSYIDSLLGSLLHPESLRERHLFRSEDQTLLTSSWAHNQVYYNISLDRCLEFMAVAGIYTSRDGTRDNATILDINKDLRFRLSTPAENELGIGSRVLENAQRASLEAEAYLQTAVCGYTLGTNSHDELRHLLAPDGYYIAVMTKSIIYGSVSAGIYTGLLNRNASIGQGIGVGIGAAGVTILDGVISRLQANGRMSFLEATIINVFTAWYRRAVQVGADSQGSACLSEIVIHDALGSLAESSDPSFYFDAISQLEIEKQCH